MEVASGPPKPPPDCVYGPGCLIKLVNTDHDKKYLHLRPGMLPPCTVENCPQYVDAFISIFSEEDIPRSSLKHVALTYHEPLKHSNNVKKLATIGGSKHSRRHSVGYSGSDIRTFVGVNTSTSNEMLKESQLQRQLSPKGPLLQVRESQSLPGSRSGTPSGSLIHAIPKLPLAPSPEPSPSRVRFDESASRSSSPSSTPLGTPTTRPISNASSQPTPRQRSQSDSPKISPKGVSILRKVLDKPSPESPERKLEYMRKEHDELKKEVKGIKKDQEKIRDDLKDIKEMLTQLLNSKNT